MCFFCSGSARKRVRNLQRCNPPSLSLTRLLDATNNRGLECVCLCTVDDNIYQSTKSWAGSHISSQNGRLCSWEQWLVTLMGGAVGGRTSWGWFTTQWSCSPCWDASIHLQCMLSSCLQLGKFFFLSLLSYSAQFGRSGNILMIFEGRTD